MIMLMSVLLEAWGQVYVWILLTLRPQPSCVTAPSCPNAAPHMLWAASITCCPLPPFCLYPIAPPLSSLIKHVSSITGFSLAVPSSPIHFLGGRPTLSSQVLPVLGLLHHVAPCTAPPPSPALLNLDCALSFPLIFSTSHGFSLSSLISPLSPLIIPIAQMWFSIHASKMAGSRLDTFPVYILGSLAIFLTRSQNVTDPPNSTHLYTSITWSRAWDVIST